MLDKASERAVMSKITWRLIPFMFILYIVAYLDRVNVSFAKLHMQEALGPAFSETVFGAGMGVFFLGYFLLEVPSNLIMEKVGARPWIARIMITWGLLAAAMMFVRTVPVFYGMRFALGLAEAGFFPGMILYLTYWFPAAERARAVGKFMTATAVANILGGPFSGWLLGMHGMGGLEGWQWLFLLQGLPACLLGFVVLVYLPNGPKDAKWLTPEERDWITSRLEHEGASGGHKHATLGSAMMSPKVWLLCAIYFAQATGSYGFAFWLPSILKGTYHVSDQMTGFMVAVPYIAAAIGLVVIGVSSDRTHERKGHVAFAAMWGAFWIAFAAILLSGKTPLPEEAARTLALVGFVLAPFGMSGTLGPFWAIPNTVLAGSAAAGGIAMINSVGNLGGYLGGFALGKLKDLGFGFTGGLLFVAGAYFLLGVLALTVQMPKKEVPAAVPEPA
ncbi:MAG: major facilitator superfamily 1 [Armatimonadetes bacterium]|jgi:sugar phosphate permease|nr:major facilitator superfamily 1 [Armatimonadota bacterium]